VAEEASNRRSWPINSVTCANGCRGRQWPDPPKALCVTLGTGVYDAWQAYSKATRYDLINDDLDQRLHGCYGRLPVQAWKVAMVLAALDWQESPAPVIELPHLARAIGIVETWRASAHRALAKVAATEFERLQQRIIVQLSRHEPHGATLRDLYKSIRDRSPEEIEMSLGQLQKVNMVDEIEAPSGKRGGDYEAVPAWKVRSWGMGDRTKTPTTWGRFRGFGCVLSVPERKAG